MRTIDAEGEQPGVCGRDLRDLVLKRNYKRCLEPEGVGVVAEGYMLYIVVC